MSNQTVQPEDMCMSGGQVRAMCSALGNAVDLKTRWSTAQYILGNQDMIHTMFCELSLRAEQLEEWQKFYKRKFNLELNLSHFQTPHYPNDFDISNCTFVFRALELSPTLLFKLCRRELGLEFKGKVWQNFMKQKKSFWGSSKSMEDIALEFFKDIQPVFHRRRGTNGEGVWVSNELIFPREKIALDPNGKIIDNVYAYRCVTLTEFLLFVLKSHFNEKAKGKEQPEYVDGKNKCWCLGSSNMEYGMISVGVDCFYPLVYADGHLIIECQKRESGDDRTGTRYVTRLP